MAFVDRPWDGGASRFGSTADFCRACLINENTGDPKDWVQAQCHLPVKEPNGDYNRNAIRNARARIGQVQASAAAKKKAQARLDALAKQAGIGQ